MKLWICFLLLLIPYIDALQWNSKPKPDRFKVQLNERGQFIDNFRRVRMFHGFNSVQKDFPWYQEQMLNVTKLKLFKAWGFNIVRLGTMWSGVEPVENKYSQSYIGILQEIVRRFDEYGMYSLLDMHQDVLSSAYGTYDGIPLWLVDKFPKFPDIYRYPYPFESNSTSRSWASNYITYAACDGYQNLYKSDIGLDHWTRFWLKMTETFANATSVIGYELINEPWVGNFYKDPPLLLPGIIYCAISQLRYSLLPIAVKFCINGK